MSELRGQHQIGRLPLPITNRNEPEPPPDGWPTNGFTVRLCYSDLQAIDEIVSRRLTDPVFLDALANYRRPT